MSSRWPLKERFAAKSPLVPSLRPTRHWISCGREKSPGVSCLHPTEPFFAGIPQDRDRRKPALLGPAFREPVTEFLPRLGDRIARAMHHNFALTLVSLM